MTSLGLVLLAADDVEEPRTLGTERQQGHLKHSRHHGDAQQDRPQLLAAQQRLQTQDLQRGTTRSARRFPGQVLRSAPSYLSYEDPSDYRQLVQSAQRAPQTGGGDLAHVHRR